MVAEEPQQCDNVSERNVKLGGWFVFQLNAGETETQMEVCWWCVSESEVNQKEIDSIGLTMGSVGVCFQFKSLQNTLFMP